MESNMMTKWVITTVELVKRVNIVDAYTKIDAYDKLCDLGSERDVQAVEVEVIGDHIIHEETINEYEYNKDWKPQPDYNEGADYHLQGPECIDVSAGDGPHQDDWIDSIHDGSVTVLDTVSLKY
jgi:hypothetical protein|tara:strand:- start:2056 stop:2427 length:372 start_codon:yes stop_codon:yes gene_type:complete